MKTSTLATPRSLKRNLLSVAVMLQLGCSLNAFSADLATEPTLSKFHYYDVLVDGNTTYALVGSQTATQIFSDPDNTKFPVREVWLLKINNNTREITWAPKIGNYAPASGVLTLSENNIHAFFNYKTQNGTYAMDGKFFSWNKQEFYSSTEQSLFNGWNCGWYPRFANTNPATVEHFCYSGYYRYKAVTPVEFVQPAVMAQEYSDILKTHSQSIMPKATDAEVVQAILNSLPPLSSESDKKFTQADIDTAYQKGLNDAPKGFTQAEVDAAYQKGLANAPKGFTQADIDTAKSIADKTGYERGYKEGVLSASTTKPPVTNSPVITSITPNNLKENQAIKADPNTSFNLVIKGSNFSNPAVFIPGIEQTIVSSSATEIVLKVTQVYGSSVEKLVPQGDRAVLVKNKDSSGNVVNQTTKSNILTVTDKPVQTVQSPLANLKQSFDFCSTTSNGSIHKGTDYSATLDEPVYSMCDGTVKLNNTTKDYGNVTDNYWNSFLIVEHSCSGQSDKTYGYYGHLTSNKLNGSKVDKGEIIGYIRKSYNENGTRTPNNDHLHLGISTHYQTNKWGYSPANTNCDAVQAEGWLDPKKYLTFQSTPTLALTGLSVNCPVTTLKNGEKTTCKATATFSDKSTKAITASWSSSNKTALTVDQNGNLTAGNVSQNTTVRVTASYADKGVTKTSFIDVAVTKPVDTTKPTGKITSSILSSYTKGDKINVSWSASDDKQLAKASFNVASAGSTTAISSVSKTWALNSTSASSSYTIDTSVLSAGTYNYALWVKDATGNEQSYTGSFTVKEPLPKISSISPTTATLNKKTTLTVNGTNLPNTLVMYIPDCNGMTSIGRSATLQTFSCTPINSKGQKAGQLKDKPNGTVLRDFTVSVK